MGSTKRRGDRAELEVATELIRRGYRVAIPFGEDADYDLILDRGQRLERVQVKYACSDGLTIIVRCRSVSLTHGKVRSTKRYTAATIDWLAVFDATTEECFFIPAWELGQGRNTLTLRLAPAANNQRVGIRHADRYRGLEQAARGP
ncbi:MAG: group I intron-associated PD-(D/E)XK endonuclease [Solirubrobacterales bacterium]